MGDWFCLKPGHSHMSCVALGKYFTSLSLFSRL
jgi:hypothetical protein